MTTKPKQRRTQRRLRSLTKRIHLLSPGSSSPRRSPAPAYHSPPARHRSSQSPSLLERPKLMSQHKYQCSHWKVFGRSRSHPFSRPHPLNTRLLPGTHLEPTLFHSKAKEDCTIISPPRSMLDTFLRSTCPSMSQTLAWWTQNTNAMEHFGRVFFTQGRQWSMIKCFHPCPHLSRPTFQLSRIAHHWQLGTSCLLDLLGELRLQAVDLMPMPPLRDL